MKRESIIFILLILILSSLFGQESVNTEHESLLGQDKKQTEYKKNKFTILLDFPSLAFFGGDWGFKTNAFKGIGTGFDYHFSEIISLGLHASYFYSSTTYLETDEKEIHRTIDIAPMFKVNLGRNQIVIPFLEASYMLSIGNFYNNMEKISTTNYVRHIISGGIGLKIYASRWFKKTKYKNNFGIELCFSKALLLLDNSINVPLLERDVERISFFYRF
jgi:hypothetical protein